jgi:serine/threonine-protein kinase HipA
MSEPESIPVHYDQFVVGQISVATDGTLGFQYEPRWLATTGAFPLSVTMPLRAGPFDETLIAPWLANLLPEEQQLVAVSRTLGLSASDSLAILREIGGDTAGAISIGAPSLRADWSYQALTDWYQVPDPSRALSLHFDDLGLRPFMAGVDGIRLSLAGGQKKSALAVLDRDGRPKLGSVGPVDALAVPTHGAPSTIIIKPDNPMLPGIVENECYCMTLAGLIGIPVAATQIISFENRTALSVVRYDRDVRADGSIRRLHQEDFAQANNIYPGQKYEQGTIPGLTMTGLLQTGRHLPAAEALKMLDHVIFNILVANTDAHAKNFSMILTGGPRMAPLYDVSTVLMWTHVNQHHAQKLAGSKRKPGDMDRRHWDQIANDAGLGARGVRLRVQELIDSMVASRVAATANVAGQLGATEAVVEEVAALVEGNALRIEGRL